MQTVKHAAVDLCVSYFNDRFLSEIGATCWIAGGAIRDWWTHRKPQSDVDVWFPNQGELAKAKESLAKSDWTLTKETPASVNYRTSKGQWVQLVQKHFFQSMEETLKQFDFTVCTAGTDGTNVMVHDDFFVDLSMKRLAFNAIPYPVSSFKRSAKYAEKGYRFCPIEQGKLLAAMQAELRTSTLEESESRYME